MTDQIKKVLVYLQLALGIVPMIVELVKSVELPGNGAEKLNTVLEIVKAAYALIPEDAAKAIGLDKVQGFVAQVVPIIVNLMNIAGIFKKGK